jgi:hypothetical protein
MGFPLVRAITIYCDNQSCVKMAKSPQILARNKHIEKACHLVCDYVKKGRVVLEYVRSKEQIADILTKPLSKVHFQEMRDRLQLTTLQKFQNPKTLLKNHPWLHHSKSYFGIVIKVTIGSPGGRSGTPSQTTIGVPGLRQNDVEVSDLVVIPLPTRATPMLASPPVRKPFITRIIQLCKFQGSPLNRSSDEVTPIFVYPS